MKYSNISIVAAAAFVLALSVGLLHGKANASGKAFSTYHIYLILPSGNYKATTSGSCSGTTSRPCQFTTNLSPDQEDGSYSPEYLEANGVTVTTGNFNP